MTAQSPRSDKTVKWLMHLKIEFLMFPFIRLSFRQGNIYWTWVEEFRNKWNDQKITWYLPRMTLLHSTAITCGYLRPPTPTSCKTSPNQDLDSQSLRWEFWPDRTSILQLCHLIFIISLLLYPFSFPHQLITYHPFSFLPTPIPFLTTLFFAGCRRCCSRCGIPSQ